MTGNRRDIDELVVDLASSLEDAGVPYAIGGAIAYGVHAVPRATQDIDINIFVAPEDAATALETLTAAGVELNVDDALEQLRDRGDTRGRADDIRVDVFANSIPLHWDAARRRRRVEFGGEEVWFLSIEDLLALKLLFFRPKDIEDCKRAVALLGEDLDVDYVAEQLRAHVGDGLRLQRWNEIVDEFDGS